nr:hypothetical protein [uncultured Roseateles sp.]
MQNQATQTQTLDQAARQDVKPGQTTQPIELDLQQLKAVSGGTGETSSPVKGW